MSRRMVERIACGSSAPSGVAIGRAAMASRRGCGRGISIRARLIAMYRRRRRPLHPTSTRLFVDVAGEHVCRYRSEGTFLATVARTGGRDAGSPADSTEPGTTTCQKRSRAWWRRSGWPKEICRRFGRWHLPPQSLLALKKLSIAEPAAFTIAPALWARLVYDFALAFHLRDVESGSSARERSLRCIWRG